jgi:hypothetical protein
MAFAPPTLPEANCVSAPIPAPAQGRKDDSEPADAKFDPALREAAVGPPTPETRALRQILAGIAVPELEPVPRDHVITKAFYLIETFPGRYADGQTWIEALPREGPDAERPAAGNAGSRRLGGLQSF